MSNKKTEFIATDSLDKEPPSTRLNKEEFYKKNFPTSTPENWNDWKWQLKHCIKSFDEINKIFGTSLSTNAIDFPMSITPHYLSLIKDVNGPLAKMFFTSDMELVKNPHCSDDPLNEEHQMPVKNLVHRYKDRALIITTSLCAGLCRYCVRKRCTNDIDHSLNDNELNGIKTYIENHPEIKDVILSGGDFLTMNNNRIEKILTTLGSIESVDIIRIGSKIPVMMPQRIFDTELIRILSSCPKPLYLNTHFNHPDEVSEDSIKACVILAKNGVQLGNQSVLLKDVNDKTSILLELYRKLLKMFVKPYYAYCCDEIHGTEHFRIKFSDAQNVIDGLRGHISGLGIPTLILDSPHGLGKINVSKNHVVSIENIDGVEKTTLTSFEGKLVEYYS